MCADWLIINVSQISAKFCVCYSEDSDRPNLSDDVLFITKCSQRTHNSVTLNRLKITQTWSVHFKTVSKGLWMEENKLKLNNDKTEAIHFSSSSSANTTLQHPQTVSLSNTDVEFTGTVHHLSFIFDSDLSIKQHIIKTCKAAYIEIRHVSSIRQYLTEDAAKTIVNSCILSSLDYCNSLLQFPTGYPQSHQTTPTSIELCSQTSLNLRAEHAKPLLKQLHWLPIEQRIKYKIVCLCYQIITGTAPQYLADPVQIYVPSRSLR